MHVRDLGLQAASDLIIFRRASAESRILLSSDSDFGTLLALRAERFPSFILFRRQIGRIPAEQLRLLLKHLPLLEADLAAGSIVVLEQSRLRIRRLPITTPDS